RRPARRPPVSSLWADAARACSCSPVASGEALVEGPWARANDEQKHRAQQHAKIRTGLVSHAEKAVRGQRLEAEPPKALPEQDRDFGRYECDQHIDDERYGCQSCQKAGEHT